MTVSLWMVCLLLPGFQSQGNDEVQKLIEQLGASTLKERDAATEALADKGKAALEAVKKAAGSKDPEVAMRAKQVIEWIGLRDRLGQALRQRFEWLEKEVRRDNALGAWERLRSEGAKLTEEEWQIVLGEVGRALGEVTREGKQSLIGFMQEKKLTRGVAAELWMSFLKDGDGEVRGRAAYALGGLQAKEMAPTIAGLLKDGDAGVRSVAAYALGELQAKEFAPQIAGLLKDGEAEVRWRAADALVRLQAKEFAPQIAGLLKDGEAAVRGRAAYALGGLQAKEMAPTIAGLLKDGRAGVRMNAAYALGELQAKEVVPKIAELLKDENAGVRGRAADALGELQAKEYLKEIRGLLEDPDEDVRAAARRAIKRLEEPEKSE